MSVQATAWVWEHSSAEGQVRLVALAIADAANKEGRGSCQAVPTLAAMCRISERSVQRALRSLEDAGEIRPAGQSRRYRTTVYEFPALAGVEGDTGGTEGVRSGIQGVTGEAFEGDTPVTRSHLPQRETPKSAAVPAAQAPEAVVAKALYDATAGALPFMGMRTIAGWAITAKHAEPERVQEVALALYNSGKPVTKVLVAQVLDGALKLGIDGLVGYSGRMSRTEETQGVLERGMARAVQHEQARGPSQAVGW